MRKSQMIKLTRLNSQTLFVNPDLIKFVERAPDTVLTLVNGEKVVVSDSCDEVLVKIVEFRRSISGGWSGAASDATADVPETDCLPKTRNL
jgi:flagellar protein FlbD